MIMTKDPITLIAVGDLLIDREQPETIFQHVVEVLQSGDITFANCEQMYSDKGQPRPGHALPHDPKNIPALLYAGILGFHPKPYFSAAPGAENAPKVQFDFGKPAAPEKP